MEFRPALPSDLDDFVRWLTRSGLFLPYGTNAGDLRPALLAALSDPTSGSAVRVALHEGRALGFAWIVRKGGFARSAYLRLIAVDPDVSGGGVGTALMASLEAEFLSPNGLFLLATTTNSGARRFYERLGYRLVGEIPGYVKPGVDEAIYFKAAV